MAKEYFGKTALTALIGLIKKDLKGKVNTSDIVDEYGDGGSDKVLSASAGKKLAEMITESGKGHMTESVYAKNEGAGATTGKVDHALMADNAADAEKLGGKAAEAYLEASKVGAAGGVAPLNAQSQIDATYLPSYVDDVIEGYYYEGEFYNEEAHSSKITGESGKIYVDIGSADSTCYRYSGSTYIKIVSSDMVEIGAEEVTNLWTSTPAAT